MVRTSLKLIKKIYNDINKLGMEKAIEKYGSAKVYNVIADMTDKPLIKRAFSKSYKTETKKEPEDILPYQRDVVTDFLKTGRELLKNKNPTPKEKPVLHSRGGLAKKKKGMGTKWESKWG
tara:strand:- start:10 stop:369 length:360 start_codon:yes stop_codon:yes gene_type:complete